MASGAAGRDVGVIPERKDVWRSPTHWRGYPDGRLALMLVAARLRHVAATHRGLRRYMNMTLIEEMNDERAYAAARLQTEVAAK